MRFVCAVVFLVQAAIAAVVPQPCPAATYHVAQQHPQAADANPGTADAPWKTVSRAAEALQPGDTVVIHKGVYREHVRPARSGTADALITYRAAAGEDVVLTGADQITEFVPAGDKVWKHASWTHKFPTHPNDERHRLIGRCEQVIVDGKLLRQVEKREEVVPGTFCADVDAQALYLSLPEGDDPHRHVVEASVRPFVFGLGFRQPKRDYLHVRGLTIRYAANMAQRGPMYLEGDHCLVEDCRVEWANGSGITIYGDNNVLRRSESSDNGQQGLNGTGRSILIEEVRLNRNNRKGYFQSWEAGAMKIAHARDVMLRRCEAIGNRGNGFWFDIDVRDAVVEQCLARDNAGHGIFVEISGDFNVRNNLCVGNGTENGWGDAGIAIGESDHCVVENNTCVLNPTGITLRELGPRTCDDIHGKEVTYHVHDVTVRRNICGLNHRFQIGLWWDNDFFGPHPTSDKERRPLDPAAANLQFENNVYWPADKAGLAIVGCPWRPKHAEFGTLDAWLALGWDRGSIVADPRFAETNRDRWELLPGSKALKLNAGVAAAVGPPTK
ncbi:MAG: right-handed parallel beta-helix repeat-containing protein [Planctomycetota bacterium]